jgi:hypothetical protein
MEMFFGLFWWCLVGVLEVLLLLITGWWVDFIFIFILFCLVVEGGIVGLCDFGIYIFYSWFGLCAVLVIWFVGLVFGVSISVMLFWEIGVGIWVVLTKSIDEFCCWLI